jgi:hypothetical protein
VNIKKTYILIFKKIQEEPLARFAFNLGVEDVRLLSGEELSHKKVSFCGTKMLTIRVTNSFLFRFSLCF